MNKIMIAILMLLCGISYAQDCEKPFSIRYNSIGTDSLSFRWSSNTNGAILGYQVAYSLRGAGLNNARYSDTISSKNYTLTQLRSATQYQLYVRTICAEGMDSGWNGPFLFTTNFINPTNCETFIALQDDNCDLGGETYFIEISQQGKLGEDVFLESVDLILEHPWLADMQLILENPAGSQTYLSRFSGAAQDDFGVVTADCSMLTTFSSNACDPIGEGKSPFVGVYQPSTSLVNINDGSNAKGLWKLHICDRSLGDKGVLRYLRLNLTPQLCEPITDFSVSHINGSSVQVNWTPPFNCESLRIEYGEAGFTQGQGTLIQLNCKNGSKVIQGLNPDVTYDFYLIGDCITSLAAPSCRSTFKTLCADATLTFDFDQLPLCQGSCTVPCDLIGVWTNVYDEDDVDWIVWQGPTDTDNTGPPGDINGSGKYLYVESSPDLCGKEKEAILVSNCISVGDKPGCGVGLAYHILGNNPGQLSIDISEDDGITWNRIYETNTVSSDWQRAVVNLDPYLNQFVKLRIVGRTSQGVESDIAIDQIAFYGSMSVAQLTVYRDQDGDGYGDQDSLISICEPIPLGYVVTAGDCNDNNGAIHPSADEVGCNGVDENCNGTDDDNLTPPVITATITNESCFGLKDGAITLDITGDKGPYIVEWVNTSHTGTDLQGLPSGFYKAIVTDNTQCKYFPKEFQVKAESKIAINIERIGPTTCYGRSNGTIYVIPSGGIEPYSYQWSNGDDHSGFVIALTNRKYVVTVTDAEGCQQVSDSIFVPSLRKADLIADTLQNISCYGEEDGYISLDVSNGRPPYRYTWFDGDSSAYKAGLKTGEYSVVMVDADFCRDTNVFTIKEPLPLSQQIVNVEPIKCNGDKNGSIRTFTVGGTPPYSYLWSSGQSVDDIYSLQAGAYSLVVTDINGCTATSDTIILIEPDALVVNLDTLVSATCRLSMNGGIDVSVSGGTEPYRYYWRNTPVDNTSLMGIGAGAYTFSATDLNNCKVSILGIEVPYGNKELALTSEIIAPHKCPNDEDAAISVVLADGQSPFNYNWSNGVVNVKHSNADTLSLLGSGIYQVTVTDGEGCVSTSQLIQIDNLQPLDHTIVHLVPNVCKEDSIGQIEIEVSGGTKPYRYLWSNNQTQALAANLGVGIQKVEVLDSNNCLYVIDNLLMYATSNLTASSEVINASFDKDDGQIMVDVFDGVPNYQISWMDDPIKAFDRSNLAPGVYIYEVTDGLNCTLIDTVEVDRLTAVVDMEQDSLTYKFARRGQILFFEIEDYLADVRLYQINGQEVKGHFDEGQYHLPQGLETGIYILHLQLVDGTTVYYKVFLLRE